ncbi:hypothetical protein O6H91_12G023900 [Diphasiastrum complanatum]|uniref:Uncharacterized protein n=1 Tax=Diphasiastrum complanatum TaxID=34168 RepID=A0ACC2BZQ7_DIPCM|nr:hypothetical protein O6H91_12G023900 [Diphasiastrum complanatum]
MSFAGATAISSCGLPSAPSIPLLRRNSVKIVSCLDAPALSGRLVTFFGKGWKNDLPQRRTHSFSSSFLGEGLAGFPKASYQGISNRRAAVLIRCEQASGGGNNTRNNINLWLGRFAMLGFVGVISIEIITGKGVLQQVGINSPAPTAALALMAVVGTIVAIAIFRSASTQ